LFSVRATRSSRKFWNEGEQVSLRTSQAAGEAMVDAGHFLRGVGVSSSSSRQRY
jgi:hypothetical protein